jgi:beta-lactamase regulating signal transducer with metallopeptidase domain
MDRFVVLLESEFCTNLLLALAHTLWQGALAAGILFVYLRRTPAQAANRRYIAGVAALGAVVLGALLTWSILSYKPAGTRQGSGDTGATTGVGIATSGPTAPEPAASHRRSPVFTGREPLPTPKSRQVWIMEAWLAGVVAMLLRLAATVIGGGRLRRRCRATKDLRTLDLVQGLRDKMGIGRSIRVLVGERISSPGVIGCFWPTVLLPASMVSGIPAEDLQAILVHELAHIRRYDYLVNFLQMVVEALLFFNPAVWWISRQIRIEREACCDAAGVRWTGQGARYAEALVAWAHRTTAGPAPAVGFGKNADGGSVLDRVRRILIAGHQPRPRAPWHIAAAMVVLTLACLVLIQQTTSLAVTLAGRIFTPQERIAKIAEISKEYGPRAYSEKDRIHISGVARTWDGKPLSGQVFATVRCDRADGWNDWFTGLSTTIQRPNSEQIQFSGLAEYGRLFLAVSAPGYAPAFTGPLTAEPGGRIEGIELVLREGYHTHIRAVDETGQPVQGAELLVGYAFPSSGLQRLITDANGAATLDHLAAQSATVAFKADGFQTDRIDGIVFDPNGTKVVTLRRAQPVTGMVLSEATGRPVAGAEVHVLGSARLNDPSEKHDIGQVADAVTDASGRFKLTRLHQDRKYLFFVRAPGHGCRYVPDIKAGDKDITVKLGARKLIRGRVIGDLSSLPKGPGGEPFVEVDSRYDFPDFWGSIGPSSRAPVSVRDGVGYFQIDDPYGRMVYLTAGDESVSVRPEQDPLDDVVIELVRPILRPVVLRFKTPQGAPPIRGSVRVSYNSERGIQRRQGWASQFLNIQDGEARCDVPVPGRLGYSIGNGYPNAKEPIGYWFPEVRSMSIASGQDPCIIEVPVRPAGAIYGKILGPDDNIAANAREVLYIKNPEILERGPFKLLGHVIKGVPSSMDYGQQRGTFKVTPLPLGGDYVVVAWEGNRFAASRVIRLDEEHPIVEVNLQLLQGVKVVGQLLDAEGHPVRIPIALFGEPAGSSLNEGGIGGNEVNPDENGRFVFENVSPGPTGVCVLSVWPRANYQAVLQRIEDLRPPVTIRLQKGLRLRGTVIDDATAWPVPNVTLQAFQAPEGEDYPHGQFPTRLMPEGPTNQRGEFVFSNLSAGRYEVLCFNAARADGRQATVATAGQTEPVTVRITIPKWRDLQPQRP